MSFDESIGDHVIASQQVSPLKCWPVWKISTDNAGSDNPERGEKEKKKNEKERHYSINFIYIFFLSHNSQYPILQSRLQFPVIESLCKRIWARDIGYRLTLQSFQ